MLFFSSLRVVVVNAFNKIYVFIVAFFLLNSACSFADDKIPSFALENALERNTFTIDTIGAKHVNVFSEKDFLIESAIKPIIFELRNNITISSPIHIQGSKSYCIKGNGFSISEKVRPKVNCSLAYQARSWYLDRKNKLLKIRLKEPIDIRQFRNRDSIYVVYEGWFLRFKDRMVSINDSILTIQCCDKFLSNRKFLTHTPTPYFYLEERPVDNIEFVQMFSVQKGTKILIDNVNFIGASSCCISNAGMLKIQNCHFNNMSGGAIKVTGELYVDKSHFSDITSYGIQALPRSYLEVTNSVFKEMGLKGSNYGCIITKGYSYIANNIFIDFNYAAVRLGRRNCSLNVYPSSIVEGNIMKWTPDWEKKMKVFGLVDGGAIYVSTCNKRTIIRGNTIINFGGHGSNRAIYCDDGAFNVTIYGNVIKGTRNSYDIDSRDCSRKWEKQKDAPNCPNTGNYIGYNICDGKLKLEGASVVIDNGCVFEYNVIVGRNDDAKDIVNNNYKKKYAIVYDSHGHIDDRGRVFLKKAKKTIKIKAPFLKQE